MLDWMKYKLESRNSNNLRYADDITFMAEREEELKSLLMKVKSESEVITQSCSSLCDPMDCSLPGSCVHGIFQARVLEWGAIAFSHWADISLDVKGKKRS